MEEKQKLIDVYIMGKRYQVPETLTIMKAMEYAGYQLVRGAGCRGGVCGACATVYRMPGNYKVEICLACQKVVEHGMYLAQLPFFPAKRSTFDLENVKASVEVFQALYPEVFRCVSCNTCTKSCPMDIEVMDYINAIIRGDIEKAAKLSFDCVMCGLCTSRCPAEISHYNVAELARRIYARYMVPKAEHLDSVVNQVKEGKFRAMLSELKGLDREALTGLYKEREVEPDMSDESWVPEEKKYL